jgi:hypothetical protein
MSTRSPRKLATTTAASAKSITKQFAAFGRPPLIPGEDLAAYNSLLLDICERVQTADVLERIFVRDIVDLQWEVLRLRRLKASFMAIKVREAVEAALEPLMEQGEDGQEDDEQTEQGEEGEEQADQADQADQEEGEQTKQAEEGAEQADEDDEPQELSVIDAWALRDPGAIDEVNKLLASQGLTVETVSASSLCENLDTVNVVDSMIAEAERRRNDALRELERHRTSFARALDRAITQVDDVEYQVIAPNADEAKGGYEH